MLRLVRNVVAVAALVLSLPGMAHASLIAFQINTYSFAGDPTAVVIESRVYDNGAMYFWEYTVFNHSYDPIPAVTNGFSGFELALPGGFVSDLGGIVLPGPGWETNCCSGLPMEWDIKGDVGLGIMPTFSGIFGFTTLPRTITTADAGWFHSWIGTSPVSLQFYGAGNAPLAPDLLLPPLVTGVPEPATLLLLGAGLLGVAGLRRRGTR